MKKFAIIILAVMISAVSVSACSNSVKSETAATEVAKNTPKAEIIYFHGKQRCKTCIAIENETKALVEGELAALVKEGKLSFRIVDISTPEGKKLADKYKVTFSSLFIVTPKGAEDLTRFAFANARSNAEGFRQELKDKVMKAVK